MRALRLTPRLGPRQSSFHLSLACLLSRVIATLSYPVATAARASLAALQ